MSHMTACMRHPPVATSHSSVPSDTRFPPMRRSVNSRDTHTCPRCNQPPRLCSSLFLQQHPFALRHRWPVAPQHSSSPESTVVPHPSSHVTVRCTALDLKRITSWHAWLTCGQRSGYGGRPQLRVDTGTVLQGSVARGDTVELPEGRLQRKVKSLQRFKQPCGRVSAGERAGMCLTSVPPAKLERTFVSAPGLLHRFSACVCMVQRCRFYTGAALRHGSRHRDCPAS